MDVWPPADFIYLGFHFTLDDNCFVSPPMQQKDFGKTIKNKTYMQNECEVKDCSKETSKVIWFFPLKENRFFLTSFYLLFKHAN